MNFWRHQKKNHETKHERVKQRMVRNTGGVVVKVKTGRVWQLMVRGLLSSIHIKASSIKM